MAARPALVSDAVDRAGAVLADTAAFLNQNRLPELLASPLVSFARPCPSNH